MVVFACNSCGTSLKKNQVDKHVFQCRCASVSCMDCQKDFSIKDYGAHLKCISEVEKYSATGWKPPANFNKGEKKQQAWVDTVNATLKEGGSSLNPACRSLLQAMSKHDNVPRKKPKFLNFIRNVSKNRFDERTIDTVWTLVEQQWKSQAAAAQKDNPSKSKDSNGNGNAEKDNDVNVVTSTTNEDGTADATNGSQEGETAKDKDAPKLSKREKKEARRQKQNKEEKKEKREKNGVSEEDVENMKNEANGTSEASSENKKESKKDKKKRKRAESETECERKKNKGEVDEDDETQEGDDSQVQQSEELDRDFKWGQIIKEVLLKQPDYEISMKKLRKKVLSEYYAVVGDSKGNKTKEELISKLNKKLKKQQFKVLNDSVKLIMAE